MYDILPFPNITGETPEEQLSQINSYLIQLKEELEFQLMSISMDNLSIDLRQQLASLGADVDTNRTEQEVVTQQIINRSLTVDDVLGSSAFKDTIQEVTDRIEEVTDRIEEAEGQIPEKYVVDVIEGESGIVFQTANEGDKVLTITFDSTQNTISCKLQGV